MTDNKGQILPLFIIIIPIILIFVSYVVDLGIMATDKRKLNNIVKDAVSYYINHDSENVYGDTLEYLNKNIKSADITILDYDDYVVITVIKKRKSIYSIININNEIRVEYVGYKESKRIIKG